MKLFVTGGAGFIGSNYVRHIINNTDDHVTVFDALTYAGNRLNLSDLEGNSRFSFIVGDVCDRASVETSLPGHDAVIHFAAESHVDRSINDPDAFIRTNCDGTNVLCDVARKFDIQKFVHVSTDEVYGSIEEGSFTEDDPLSPRSPYSASKAGSDLIANSYYITHGLPLVTTRSSNNYGPYQFPEKIIPLFITNLLDEIKVPIYGDGRNIRDWCHVVDNCRGIDLVLREGEIGEIYNLVGGNEITNLELTKTIFDLMGCNESMITWVEDRLGHDRRYSIDTSKASALGWSPTQSFEDGIADTVRWYRENRSWWEPLKARI